MSEPRLISKDSGTKPIHIVDPVTGAAVESTPAAAVTSHESRGARAISPEEFVALSRGHANREAADEIGLPGQFAAGVGSGLTLGLGPALLAKAGIVDPGMIEGLETTGGYFAGDLAGMALPAVLSGGEGVLARGLARTPAGLMAGAGSIAERIALGALPEMGIMGKLARPALSMGARGATEGAIVNMAHTASQSMVQDHPLTWSSIVSSGANGALLGGLLGAGIGGATGLVGGAVDAVSSGAGRIAGESRMAIAAKRLGASESEMTAAAARDGGVERLAKDGYDILSARGESLKSSTSVIAKTMRTAVEDSEAVIVDTMKTLDREAAGKLPVMDRVTDRISQSVDAAYGTSFNRMEANAAAANIVRKLRGAVEMTDDGVTVLSSGPKSWADWHASRTQLSKLARGEGINGEVAKIALDAVNDELVSSIESAGAAISKEGLAGTYTGAVANKALAEEYAAMSGRKLGNELTGAKPKLTNPDIGTLAWGTLMGHPLGAAAIVAGKGIGRHVASRLEAPIAEAAYRSAIGAKAESSRVAVGNRMTNGLRKFMKLAPSVATYTGASEPKAPKVKYDPKSFQKHLETVERLTSAQHRMQVQELSNALTAMGQASLGQAALAQYDAAVRYLVHNMPVNHKLLQSGSLGKIPTKDFLDSKEMQFMRISHAIENPMSVVDGLEDGDISIDSVRAIKYVYPELHASLVDTARREMFEFKQEGKFLPADKVALLATALDEPIDSTLTKEFIDTIQAAHAVNHQPPPETGPKQTTTDVTDFQTPMQRALG